MAKLTQVPLQNPLYLDGSQVVVQELFEQTGIICEFPPFVHTCPHAPQLLVSVWKLTQVPLQNPLYFDGSQVVVQELFEQTGIICEFPPFVHTCPHAPQLFTSDLKLTQVPLQNPLYLDGSQVVVQELFEQTGIICEFPPFVHTCPHAPQLFTSDLKLTQVPLQNPLYFDGSQVVVQELFEQTGIICEFHRS